MKPTSHPRRPPASPNLAAADGSPGRTSITKPRVAPQNQVKVARQGWSQIANLETRRDAQERTRANNALAQSCNPVVAEGIVPCGSAEIAKAIAAYRGVIPADRWHELYISRIELDREVAAGVAFWGYEADGALLGVVGIQQMPGVDLIRHACVLPESQGRGIGGALLRHLQRLSSHRMLVGTWAAADWAIRSYRQHGFELVSPERTTTLLKTRWNIPDRQIATSVVLANPPLNDA